MVPPDGPSAFRGSITRRCSAALIGIALVGLAGAGASLFLTSEILENHDTADRQNTHLLLLEEIRISVNRLLLHSAHPHSDHVILRLDAAFLARAFEGFQGFHRGKGGPEAHERDLEAADVADLQQLEASIHAIAGVLASARQRPGREELERIRQLGASAQETIGRLEMIHQGAVSRHLDAAGRKMKGLLAVFGGTLVATALLSLAGTLAARRRIAYPLRRLVETTLVMAEGRLDTRVPVISEDEVGQLSHAFNVMAGQLQARERELGLAQRRLEQRVREARALCDIGTQVAGLFDLGPVLRLVTEQARELLGTDVSALCLVARRGAAAAVGTTSGPAAAFCTTGECGRCRTALSEAPATSGCAVIEASYRGAHLAVPLRRGQAVIGMLCVAGRAPRTFTGEEAESLRMLASQAAIAIEKMDLYEEIRELAGLRERERISRDLHDGPTQLLALLHLKLGLARDAVVAGRPNAVTGLDEAIAMAKQAYAGSRESLRELRTAAAETRALVPVLRECLRTFSDEYGICIEADIPDVFPVELPPASEVQLVRIVQEALSNVGKHAGAERVRVRVDRSEAGTRITIEDNGYGFDVGAQRDPGGSHFGLQVMRERAEALGATLVVDSAPGSGTRVVVTLSGGAPR
jgi:two-component system nitrate/nitrite sensor histidine kinase NarX